MSTFVAVSLILTACCLVSCVIGIVIGRGISLADERREPEPGPDIVPFEDDYPTAPIPTWPPQPVPAPSQHFTDLSWRMPDVDQDMVDMEFDSFAAYIRSQTGGWVA